MKTAWLSHGEDCECVGCEHEKEYRRSHETPPTDSADIFNPVNAVFPTIETTKDKA